MLLFKWSVMKPLLSVKLKGGGGLGRDPVLRVLLLGRGLVWDILYCCFCSTNCIYCIHVCEWRVVRSSFGRASLWRLGLAAGWAFLLEPSCMAGLVIWCHDRWALYLCSCPLVTELHPFDLVCLQIWSGGCMAYLHCVPNERGIKYKMYLWLVFT